jgi:hypothetical protein
VGKIKAKAGLGPKERALHEWVATGVTLPGKSQKGVAAAIGRSAGTVSKICKGERPVHLEEIDAISNYFGPGHPPPNGVHLNPPAARDGRLTGEETALPTGGLPIEAIIGQGLWNSAGGQMSTVAARTPVPGRLEPRFLGMKQYACAFRSDPNQYVVCVPFAAMRPAPVHEDEVHVRRTRANGEHEDTIRVVRTTNGRVQLVLADAPDNTRDKILDYPSSRAGETVEIRGLVIAHMTSKSV